MRGKAFVPRDYDVFSGLDVSTKSMSVTFTNHQGFIRSLNMPHKAEPLLHYVRKHFPDQKIAFVYEAGPSGYGLYDGLAAQAYPCLIVAPSMIPRAPGQRVKTNRLDSKALSENLRGGQLKSHVEWVWGPVRTSHRFPLKTYWNDRLRKVKRLHSRLGEFIHLD